MSRANQKCHDRGTLGHRAPRAGRVAAGATRLLYGRRICGWWLVIEPWITGQMSVAIRVLVNLDLRESEPAKLGIGCQEFFLIMPFAGVGVVMFLIEVQV
jgi:hypothetical protein